MAYEIDENYLSGKGLDLRSKARKKLLSEGAIPVSSQGEFCGYLKKSSSDGKYWEIYEPAGEWGEESYFLRNKISKSSLESKSGNL